MDGAAKTRKAAPLKYTDGAELNVLTADEYDKKKFGKKDGNRKGRGFDAEAEDDERQPVRNFFFFFFLNSFCTYRSSLQKAASNKEKRSRDDDAKEGEKADEEPTTKVMKGLVPGTVVKFDGVGTGLSRLALREVFNSKMGDEELVQFIDYTEGKGLIPYSFHFSFPLYQVNQVDMFA